MSESKSRINFRQLALLTILLVLLYGQRNGWFSGSSAPQTELTLAESLLDQPLVPTRHGACRMECREITLSEIRDVVRKGQLNEAKSKPEDQPCPSWAFEGRTADGQQVRIVLAGCEDETRIVTAIDLENEYQCDCP